MVNLLSQSEPSPHFQAHRDFAHEPMLCPKSESAFKSISPNIRTPYSIAIF
jgi:hypothetical protein